MPSSWRAWAGAHKVLATESNPYRHTRPHARTHDERFLAVAVQCLESAYGFETGEEEARAQYSIAPNTLIEVFLKGTGKQADASVGSPMQLYGMCAFSLHFCRSAEAACGLFVR